jgi:predicted DNA binding CopG/RHH family protein
MMPARKAKPVTDVDPEEAALLEAYERGNLKVKSASAAERKKAQLAARETLKRDQRMNIRMSSLDMIELQAKAAKLGMPYQTLVASVLHQYLTGRLVASEN